MKIGILSDIHDHLGNLRRAIDALAEAEVLVCCGDLCSPFVIDEIGRHCSRPFHSVFGNNDGDRWRIGEKARGHSQIEIHGEFALLELGGRRVAVQHFDDVARALAGSQELDLVCFGHNHRYEVARVDETLLVNPGEVYGGLTGIATCVIYDSVAHEARRVELGPSGAGT